MYYDVTVVGAGHAGCEAAYAAARCGASVLLITMNMDHIAQMSCNPAIGGIAKGQVVREIDAMGGGQGIVTDHAAIQFRMLNSAKGAAVQSPRSQCDKVAYQKGWKYLLEQYPNINILQSEVMSFILDDKKNICGVKTHLGDDIYSRTVVLTTGTFLSGLLHFGLNSMPGGRTGDAPSTVLAQSLRDQLGLELGRLKTGTPPRILAKTIDFSQMSQQFADEFEEEFSCWPRELHGKLIDAKRRNMPCYMVYSNEKTAEIVRANLDKAPLYQGKITGVGARYCPSFEDKVVRFAHHPRHLLYLEPEGAETEEYYINGISTSLPPDVQRMMINSIAGLENAVISRYAYAIEYDFIIPHQIDRTLSVKRYPNLFSAGQINGTSGYEEAAGQGLVAGMNAAKYAAGESLQELPRDTSYIGVMIDDLVTKEIVEPYRLFTSRAEYRLHLRQDNADLRLSQFAYDNKLLPEDKYKCFKEYKELLDQTLDFCNNHSAKGKSYFTHLRGFNGEIPENLEDCLKYLPPLPDSRIGRKVLKQVLILAHYDGYLQREQISIKKLQKLENWIIPADFDYSQVSLCNEARMKLEKIRPTTLAQASRIDGVTVSEIALLQIHLSRLLKEEEK